MKLVPTAVSRFLAKALYPVYGSYRSSNWFGIVQECAPGGWQRNLQVESPQNVLAFSAIYLCVSMIADDISKLEPQLMRVVTSDYSVENTDPRSPLGRVLRKPNRYQTRLQFMNQWMVSKLMHGNTYALLERDARGIVVAQYILDPRLVLPLVADDGSVFYELKIDYLAGVPQAVRVPASEIVHDRMICPWHPLVGVSPIYAAGTSATQGIRAQANSAKFFENMSRPSGSLTSPATISDETAKRFKEEFERNFSGGNIGRLMVAGDGLKYEPMSMPPIEAQMVEQLKWTVEDVGRTFKIPLYKLGIGDPKLTSIGALNQEYYSQALQTHIEAIELLQDEALGLNAAGYEMEFDLEGLLRMDPASRAERNKVAISAGYLMPDEARASENRGPVEGGDQCYMQQQNYSLAALARRDSMAPAPPSAPGAPQLPAPPAAAEAPEEVNARELTNAIIAKFMLETEETE